MRYFKETLIEQLDFTELDLELPFYGPDKRNEVEEPESDFWHEAPSMNIHDAIQALSTLSDKGANRVYFFAHSDHHGYYITGVNLEELDPVQTKAEKEKEEEDLKRQQKEMRRLKYLKLKQEFENE